MSMKIPVSLLAFLLLLAATPGADAANGTCTQIAADTLQCPEELSAVAKEKMRMCASEDGRMKFYSWGTSLNDIGAACQFRASGGSSITFIYNNPEEKPEDAAAANELHSLRKRDGSAYYIVTREIRTTGDNIAVWVEAYAIADDKLKEVSVYDGGNDLDDSGMDAEYNRAAWEKAAKEHAYDCFFSYDPATRELFIPEIIGECATDRYRVFYFDGNGFVKRGLQPHKGLHGDLHIYEALLTVVKTDRFKVRIDRLENGSLRYASWAAESDMCKKPDIIIENGKYNEQNGEYIFSNGEYRYIVSEKGLTVKKGDKILVNQKAVPGF